MTKKPTRKAGNPTPVDLAARLVKALGADTADLHQVSLFQACAQALNSTEVCYIGCALLARHESVADASHRLDRPNCDPDIVALRDALRAVHFWQG